MGNTIFVQIASYKDPELTKTIEDLLNNAKNPENLTICICHQYDDISVLNKYRTDSRFKIIDIHYKESKGTCWARNQIQQRYSGEKYTLQLDSHHRFIKNWDSELIEMLENLRKKHNKPLLTSYIPSYNPEKDPEGRINIPWKMEFDRFIPEGAVFFLPAYMDNFKNINEPIPARFYSAHFCFTLGQFCNEVPHDPEYYFHGEEISIAARAFTWGYDLFHPHKVIAWHEYTRKGRTKHWDDDKEWYKTNEKSHARNRVLFGMEDKNIDFGKYGFGKIRSLQDYELYAGINFKHRRAHIRTLKKELPPINDKTDWFLIKQEEKIHDININIPYIEKFTFIAIIIEDKNGVSLYRQDLLHYIPSLSIQFKHHETPYKWICWPHVNGEWTEKKEFFIK
jgi:hypothetical protein